MNKLQRPTRLLFIDPHAEWLRFVKLTLADDYEVFVGQEFGVLAEAQEEEKHFDLVFIGLNLAQKNMETLSHLAQASEKRWRFIVLFPGFPDSKTARILFKAGMRDSLSTPMRKRAPSLNKAL
jgi:response regulator RpfG family c-di-GMP phosphodiesterase